MRTIEIQLFKFDELSDKAKDRAVDDCRYINVEHDWWDCIYDDAKEIGVELEYFNLGRSRYIMLTLVENVGEIVRRIVANHGKACDTYKLAMSYYARKHNGNPYSRDEFKRQIGECYLAMLDDEHDYLLSDDAVIGMIEANEYEFTASGEMV